MFSVKMASTSSMLHVRQPQTPDVLFKGDSYEFWSIKMMTFLRSEGLWEFVEASEDDIRQKGNQKQDAKALFFIQQAVDETIFSTITTATSANKAWSLLKTTYQGSNKGSKLHVGLKDVDITIQNLLECLKKGENQTKKFSPSIYMVPSTVKDHNPSSYKPRMVSIGPLHREDENLQASEGEKATHMFSLLSRLDAQEETLKACAQKVDASIDQIRSSYAETIIYNNIQLAEMMVTDACFILEFLYRITKREKSKMGNMMFVQFTIFDLLLLENQIPFIVLEHIFECTIFKFDQTTSLFDVIYSVLEHVNPFKEHKLTTSFSSNTTHHHILGLLHECYEYKDAKSSEFSNSRFPSAVELDRAGVNFKRVRDTEWPLVMEVKSRRLPCFSLSWGKPTLIMPVLDINDFTELVLKNLIAYEQFSENVTQYITSYAMAMDMLIDTEEDIAKLVESKVVVNHIGSNQEAADMINNICKEVAYRDFFYFEQWMELNRHYNSYWSINMAWLRRTYFNNPWNIIALLAGILLFVLTVVQTIFTINPV
ncbi:hypothetical protein QVD17_25470 [Tagetes erecta]|uniref:DUF4219 domain-containing protein n=1 Tax=Tagetes erecta TaxID=13708 RepID=A0AAD8KGJ5_TARER|nr:hypothetical protein QVD17_25470 [Tagetes erecta]